jgi:23S rRNA pseudouridine2605 synthase
MRHPATTVGTGDYPGTSIDQGSGVSESGEGVRLQKVLAEAGVASRRQAEILIRQGRVEVDGRTVTEMGRRVDPDTQVVRVDGDRIVTDTETVHLALNKPEGMLSTMWDDQGRRCVGDIVAERADGQRLFHVGRLDAATEGLLLLTNDGDLAHRLMHPSYELPKTYLAEIRTPIAKDLGRRLRAGVELDDGPAAVDSFRVVDRAGARVMVEIILHEGRKHIVRRLLEAVDKPVQRLVRTAIGDVHLGEQRPNTLRKLGRDEVASLYRAVDL